MKVEVGKRILAANDALAEELRERFQNACVQAVNIVGSPGAGKTSLIEQTLVLASNVRIGVIEGDLATSLDADRIRRHGAQAIQINTGGACHLDAEMIREVIASFDLNKLDIVLIENVGNLVCPANFDLGESARVIVCSVPEGDDKVLKYPNIFAQASAVVLNKIDLLPHVSFDMSRFRDSLRALSDGIPLFEVSCTKGNGLEEWVRWLVQR